MSTRMTKAELIEGYTNYLMVEHFNYHHRSKAYKFIVAARKAFKEGDIKTIEWWEVYWKYHSNYENRDEFLEVAKQLLRLMK